MKNFILIFILISISIYANAATTVKNLSFTDMGRVGKTTIELEGEINDVPEVTFNRNQIKIDIANSKIENKIQKSVGFKGQGNIIKLSANAKDQNTVSVSIDLPFDISSRKEEVSLTIKGQHIELTLPRLMIAKKNSDQAKSAKWGNENLNESYLAKLEDEQKSQALETAPKIAATSASTTLTVKKMSEAKTPNRFLTKKETQTSKNEFSFLKYGVKFLVFLLLVLGVFYGGVNLLRNGVLKKGRLSFLGQTNQIEIVGQTFVAPKKSLMLVKVQNQVFLLSNTDAGMTLVSEIKNSAAVIKDEEKSVAGNNFDDSLNLSSINEDYNVAMKEDIHTSEEYSVANNVKNSMKKSKFSEQLRKRVKEMKPMEYRG